MAFDNHINRVVYSVVQTLCPFRDVDVRHTHAQPILFCIVATFLLFFLEPPAATRYATAAPPAPPSLPKVQIRGKSMLDARASGPIDRVEIAGSLRDESGAPISSAAVLISAVAESNLPTIWVSASRCHHSERLDIQSANLSVTTDSSGRFCIEAHLAQTKVALRITYAGGALYEGTSANAKWNAGLESIVLEFQPLPSRIDLDTESTLISARITSHSRRSPKGLTVAIADDTQTVLASAPADSDGTVQFDIDSSLLKSPGSGTLTLSFAGTDEFSSAQATAAVIRSVHARLDNAGRTVRGNLSQGIHVDLRVTSSRGPIPVGTVEAFIDDVLVGWGTVHEGAAKFPIRFASVRDVPSPKVVFRYRSDVPFYEAGEPLELPAIAAELSVFVRAIPVVLGVVIAAWLLRGWWRPRRRNRGPAPLQAVRGVADLVVERRSPETHEWGGRVVDAHDGDAVVGARVRVLVPTFVGRDVFVDLRTDASGGFAFRIEVPSERMQLVVDAPYHGSIERELPPSSLMVVSLVSRRRLMLDRFLRWVTLAGRPWYVGSASVGSTGLVGWAGSAEPTPRSVVRVAEERCGDAVAGWARAVERGAFGPDPVDDLFEKQVRELEPQQQPHR